MSLSEPYIQTEPQLSLYGMNRDTIITKYLLRTNILPNFDIMKYCRGTFMAL